MKFKFLSHTADLKFRVYGKTIEEIFENSSRALFSSICEEKIKNKKKIKIKVSGKDYLNLLYNFLEELLFLIDSKDFFVSEFLSLSINKKNLSLSAEIVGDSGKNYCVHSQIKAVTYNNMFLKKYGKRWIAQVVLDV
ncbi:MAG: archease [archaeon]|nr:archease [archaeon]